MKLFKRGIMMKYQRKRRAFQESIVQEEYLVDADTSENFPIDEYGNPICDDYKGYEADFVNYMDKFCRAMRECGCRPHLVDYSDGESGPLPPTEDGLFVCTLEQLRCFIENYDFPVNVYEKDGDEIGEQIYDVNALVFDSVPYTESRKRKNTKKPLKEGADNLTLFNLPLTKEEFMDKVYDTSITASSALFDLVEFVPEDVFEDFCYKYDYAVSKYED